MQPIDGATMPDTTASEREAFGAELEQQVGSRNYELWFRNKSKIRRSGDHATLDVGTSFLLDWIQRRFRHDVRKAAECVFGENVAVSYRVDGTLAAAEFAEPDSESQSQASRRTPVKPAAEAPPPRRGRRFAELADFVVGPPSDIPMAMVRKVCQSPGTEGNPLYLYGGVGMGKTHLLEGIYKGIKRQHPHLHVMFLTAEAFANFFTQAVREHTLPSFRQRFRSLDVLLIDDVDFLDGKRVIEEEFVHTFDQLESHQRQIVLTADRHPRLLTKVSQELSTRCVSGLICRLEPLDLQTRRRILERKAEHLQSEIAPEALDYVAERFPHNVRELEGALNRLDTYFHVDRKRITLSRGKRILSDLERDCVRIVRISDIEQAVCEFFRIESGDLKSPRRHRSVSYPRMLAMFLVRKHTHAAYSEIGEHFGGRNHSTVMCAERKIKTWLQQDVPLKIASQAWRVGDIVESLEQQLYAS